MSKRLALLLLVLIAGCDPKTLTVGRVDDRLARPPLPPATPDGPSGPERVFALRDIVIEQEDGWRQIGFDLDGFVTTAAEPRQACEPGDLEPVLDGDSGIDNAFGSQVAPVLGFLLPPTFETDLNARLAAGEGTLMVKVESWNESSDDPHVRASIVQAVDGTSADPAALVFDTDELRFVAGGAPAPPPAWAGGDSYYVREAAFVATDDAAYVGDGQLVARVSRLEVVLAGAGILGTVRLDDVTLVVSISGAAEDCAGAILTGRWAIDELLATAEGLGICEDAPEWALIVEDARENADVPGDLAADPRATCDAISSAFRFESCGIGAWVASVATPPTAGPCD